MFQFKTTSILKNISKKSPVPFLFVSTILGTILVNYSSVLANTGMDFMWDPDPNYVKLKYAQSSNQRRARSTYYFFLRERDRKTGILKLTIKIPSYFDANITQKSLNFCKANVGGFSSRSKCLENIPSVIEISKDQSSIDIFPDNPIPVDKNTYALRMKIFNPRRVGMFQFHAYAQSPGALPISGYVGTWNMDVGSD